MFLRGKSTQIKEHPPCEPPINIKKIFFWFVYTSLHSSRLIYNRLDLSSDSSTLVYIRLDSSSDSSTHVYIRLVT